jgi:hypothetical protein
LSADEASSHQRLSEVWEIIDFVVTHETTVSAAVYGPGRST